jgi:hypothetical protein
VDNSLGNGQWACLKADSRKVERINTGVLYRVYFPILAEVVCVKSDQVTVWSYVVGKQANFLSTEDARNCTVRRVVWCSWVVEYSQCPPLTECVNFKIIRIVY